LSLPNKTSSINLVEINASIDQSSPDADISTASENSSLSFSNKELMKYHFPNSVEIISVNSFGITNILNQLKSFHRNAFIIIHLFCPFSFMDHLKHMKMNAFLDAQNFKQLKFLDLLEIFLIVAFLIVNLFLQLSFMCQLNQFKVDAF
jgi:hypothetical protein